MMQILELMAFRYARVFLRSKKELILPLNSLSDFLYNHEIIGKQSVVLFTFLLTVHFCKVFQLNLYKFHTKAFKQNR